MKEMSKCQCAIAELEYNIPELERNNKYLNSFVPWYPPLPASSSSSTLNNECCRDTRNISSPAAYAAQAALAIPILPTPLSVMKH